MQVLCILDAMDILKKIKTSCDDHDFTFKAIAPDDDLDDFCNSFKPDVIIFQEQYEEISVKLLAKTLHNNTYFKNSVSMLIAKSSESLNNLMDYAASHHMFLVEEDHIGQVLCTKLKALYNDKKKTNTSQHKHLSKRKSILYVSDNKFMHIIIKDAFINNSIELIEAYDVEEALVKLKESTPDMVLTDIDIPGLSGLDLCKAIKHNKTYQHIPVIVYSSYNKEDVIADCEAVGASDYFEKNINPKDLVVHLLEHF